MKFTRLLKSATEFLGSRNVPDAAADAEIILLHSLQIDRLAAYRDDPEVSSSKESHVRALLARRAEGEPVQYIVGCVDFLGLFIKVGRGVLIPRPETELLVQEAIKTVKSVKLKVKSDNHAEKKTPGSRLPAFGKRASKIKILDLCTGSGCMALALARHFPCAEVLATDISVTALEYAKENAALNKIANTVFLNGSLFDPLPEGALFDLIISNPPYIKKSEINVLQREVKDWEPLEALDGGDDGLDYYREIFGRAGRFLHSHCRVMVEIGFGQAGDIEKIAGENGFRDIIVLPDFAGVARIISAEKSPV